MPKKPFLHKNRNPLSLSALFIGFVLIGFDYYITGIGSTSLQWVIFLLMIFAVIYLQFYLTLYDEIAEITPNHWIAERKSINNVFAAEPPVIETPELETNPDTLTNQNIPLMENKNANEKTDPIVDKKEVIETPAVLNGQQVVLPITTYSNHSVPQKYRAMFDDIHQFAISGGSKTLNELEAKVKTHGHNFIAEFNGKKLVSFQFQFMRMPLNGWFGVKVD